MDSSVASIGTLSVPGLSEVFLPCSEHEQRSIEDQSVAIAVEIVVPLEVVFARHDHG